MKQRKNMRLLSVLLSLVLVVGLLPGLAMQADAAAGDIYSFTHAYDCQRSKPYPKKNETFTIDQFERPLKEYNTNGGTRTENQGNWTLTSKGLYTGNPDDYSGHYDAFGGVISNIANGYFGSSTRANEVEIFELKNGTTHIAYGALCAKGDVTLFIGDTWPTDSGGAGYVLSNGSLSGTLNVSVQQDATTGFTPSTTHAHVWHAETTGNGTLEAKTTIKCTGCDAAMDVSLTAANVTLPGDVFCAQISPAPNARAASPLSVSATPGYKYSADGSNFEDINPQTFTPKPGIYQASIVVSEGNAQVENLYVKYTVSDPAVTAATGDNRPIALMLVGLTAFATMAAVAFLLDSRRRARF